jgi:transposase InsO family protein
MAGQRLSHRVIARNLKRALRDTPQRPLVGRRPSPPRRAVCRSPDLARSRRNGHLTSMCLQVDQPLPAIRRARTVRPLIGSPTTADGDTSPRSQQDRGPAPTTQVVSGQDYLRTQRRGRVDQWANGIAAACDAGIESAPVHRPRWSVQPRAAPHLRSPARTHDSCRRQESRSRPRWRRLACTRQRQRPSQSRSSFHRSRSTSRLRLPAFRGRRIFQIDLHRSPTRRKSQHGNGVHAPRRVWFAAHGITHIERIVTDNGACYRARDFARVLHGARHQRLTPYTPRHNGKVERYHRILADEFLYARTWTSETQRSEALKIWNIHFNYHRPHSAARDQPPASCLAVGVTNAMASYI